MKRFFLLATFVCAALFTSCEGYDDSELVNRLNDFETRLKQLEETCKQLNTNISSLQTIVNAIQKNDQITAVTPVSKDGVEVGYTISFTSGKTITIYHGADGEDGTNGTNGSNGQNGADGHTPVIGVKMDADGIYYWTIDGEWLTDENGNKIQASPSEADNGSDGADGADGTDGKDGVTPQLKIENEYWYVSYDDGQTWIKLGKATGEQGPQGPQGSNGDSIFQSVTQDSNNVYFKLADGTTITIPKSSGAQSIALTYIPRYSDGKATVYYSSKNDSYVELDFEVSPASAVANWRDAATVKAVYTETRAGVQMVDMAIQSWTVDSDAGTITVKASGANLSDAFFAGTQEASARLAIDDDNLNLLSDYIPMVAKNTNAQPEPTTQPDNEIWYTSSDGQIIEPTFSNVFGANIVSNTYANGKGVIKFDGAVTSIGDQAFYECISLAEITVPNSATSIGYRAFYNCWCLTNIVIGDNVTSIGDWVFDGCTSLTEVTIPNSVTSIGAGAFACSNLQKFYGKFVADNGRCLINGGVLIAYANASGTKYSIPNSVTSIGNGAFYYSSLTEVTIPNSVASIGNWAFYRCNNLTEITIPNSVTSIGDWAFYDCRSLTNVSIGNSVTSIGEGTFSSCSSLQKFYGKFAEDNGRCLIGDGVLIAYAEASGTEYAIPNSVTSIGNYAFYFCDNLTSITIPNGVTSIGDDAFFSCDNLTSITIPNSVTSIGNWAFCYCESLQNIFCKPTTPPTGGNRMFANIHSSAKIYVPAGTGTAYKAADGWSDYASLITEKNM